MSDNGSDMQELVAAFNSLQFGNYCELGGFALLIYDQLLTSAGEVHFMWRRKISGATVVFVLNRYITLIGKTVLQVSVFWWPNQTDKFHSMLIVNRCAAPVILYMVFSALSYLLIAVFSALRVYAIWERDWKPFVLVVLVALITPIVHIYRFAQSIPAAISFPLYGCGEAIKLSESEYIRLTIVMHACAIVTDLLVIILTWIKTYEIKKLTTGLHLKTSLSTLILRDGTLYFGALLIMNVISLVVNKFSPLSNPMPTFIDTITCILISRFMLNLREASPSGQQSHQTASAGLSQLSELRIAVPDIVGDLGAPLNHGMIMIEASSGDVDESGNVITPLTGGPLSAGLLNVHGQVS